MSKCRFSLGEIKGVGGAGVSNLTCPMKALPGEDYCAVHKGDFSLKSDRERAAYTSLTADFLVCLEDGEQLKMLKRYLKSQHGLRPEEYRKRFGLPEDYPMVAPGYSALKSRYDERVFQSTHVSRGPEQDASDEGSE
jgi:hypothetical protein